MSTFEVPLVAAPQSLSVTLGGIEYRLVVQWCKPAQAWRLDISDSENNGLVFGIALVTGVDLLGQFRHLGFLGELVAFTDHALDTPPTDENLGAEGHLQFVTT